MKKLIPTVNYCLGCHSYKFYGYMYRIETYGYRKIPYCKTCYTRNTHGYCGATYYIKVDKETDYCYSTKNLKYEEKVDELFNMLRSLS